MGIMLGRKAADCKDCIELKVRPPGGYIGRFLTNGRLQYRILPNVSPQEHVADGFQEPELMPRRRHSLNPAKIKADLNALEANPPAEIFQRRLVLRRWLSISLLSLLTTVLLTVSFAPFDCWWLAFVALVPWTLALDGGLKGRHCLLLGTLTGVLFWAANLYWLWWITLVGYAAVVLYLSLYWLAAGIIVRSALRRNLPMWLVLPVVWTALEYIRAYVISGFPWFYLAHSQYSRTRLIQVADLTGQYGVSFFVAMVNGAIVDLLSAPLFVRKKPGPRLAKRILVGLVATALTAGALLGYGTWRLSQQTTTPGPVIALVQHAFPISLRGRTVSQENIFREHFESTKDVVKELQVRPGRCDLVLWPETMLPQGLNAEFLDAVTASHTEQPELLALTGYAEELADLSRQLQCPILAGGSTLHRSPVPLDSSDGWVVRNSALWFDRSWRSSRSYSKVHLVPFSEYVPFKHTWPWLHRRLRWFVPEVMEQLEPGRVFTRFELARDGRVWRLAAPICYEGTFARVCRAMVLRDGRKAVDILANLSNDGWFVYRIRHDGPYRPSTEHPQHLVQYCFRAIENRVPVVRAVNTGISGSIDSNGRIVAVVQHYGVKAMIAGTMLLDGADDDSKEYIVMHGPQVLVDSRVSVYSRVGDVFAMAVSLAAIVLAAWLIWKRFHNHKDEKL